MEKFIKNSLAIIDTTKAIDLIERDLIREDGQLNLQHFQRNHHKFLEQTIDESNGLRHQDLAFSWLSCFFGFQHGATNLKIFRQEMGSRTIWLLKFLTDDAPIPLMHELIRAYPSVDITLKTNPDLKTPTYFFQNVTHPTPIQIDKYRLEASNEEAHWINRFKSENIAKSIEFIERIEHTDTHLEIFP